MSRQTRQDWFSSRKIGKSSRHAPRHHRTLGVQPLEARRLLAVITVDTIADTIDFNDGKTSLREAVFAANTVPGAQTIEFAESLIASGPATIVLTQGELAVTDALTILGPGAKLLAIDASGSDTNQETFADGARIFNIDNRSAAAIEVSLRGLTLTGGDPNGNGGAILSVEQLSIDGMEFVANHSRGGGAISHTGANAYIVNSRFLNNAVFGAGSGGALFVEGFSSGQTVTVTDNQFTGNSAANGGAIGARAGGVATTFVIDNNAIIQNSAASSGGGIFIVDGTFLRATIRNSTISENQARNGGGIFAAQVRELAVSNTAISTNKSPQNARGGAGGGAYLLNSDVSITGSTIAGNEASAGGGVFGRMGELAISFTNIADNRALSGRGGGIVGEQGRFSLIGSTVSGNSSQSTANGGGGIWLMPGPGALPVISDSRIEGNSASGTGGGIDFRTGLEGQNSASLTLHNVTVAQNTANGAGGGLYAVTSSGGTTGPGLALFGGAILGNSSANGTGGGIHSTLASLSIQGTAISDNRARGNGGGISLPMNVSSPVQVSIVGATFEGNIASSSTEGPPIGDGGALAIAAPTSIVSIANSIFTHNSARSGGAIFRRPNSLGTPFSITNSTISGNTALLHGGGVYNERGPLSIAQSAIVGNRSQMHDQSGRGAGVFNRVADLSISASTVTGNIATGRGGGVYHNQGDLIVNSSTIADNYSDDDGGGIYGIAPGLDRILVHSSTVSGNAAPRTGGMYLRGDTTFRHSTVVRNEGGGKGAGGVTVGETTQRLELDHTIVAGNSLDEPTNGASPDLRIALPMTNVFLRNSLIGDSRGTTLVEAPLGSPDLNGNLIGKSTSAGGSGVVDPLLGPLLNNGGPTLTHALLPGSPALDAGTLISGTPLGYDQRGNPFHRAVDANLGGRVRIDIGAYESQGAPHFTPGDFNRDGVVDACDYSIWRTAFGAKTTPFEGADANGSGIVDQADYAIWKTNFGKGLTIGGRRAEIPAAVEVAEPEEIVESATATARESSPQPSALPGVIRSANSRRAVLRARLAAAPTEQILAQWSAAQSRALARRLGSAAIDAGEAKLDDAAQESTAALDLAFAAIAPL